MFLCFIIFSKVDETHTGTYTCTPFNDLGTEGPSTNMHVIVQRPPVFVRTPHNLYLKKLGETIEMPCDARDAENGHKPIIVWYKVRIFCFFILRIGHSNILILCSQYY